MTKPLGLAVVALVLAACIVPASEQSDGAACSANDDCKSRRCHDGYCAGSTCNPKGNACDDGWKCVHVDADPVTGFFGNDGSEICQPTCGHCPGNYHCAADASPGTLCRYGKPPLELELAVEDAVVGRPVRFTASEKSGARLVHCAWDFGENAPPQETDAAEVTHTYAVSTEYTVAVSCRDDADRNGSTQRRIAVFPAP